MTVEYVLFPVPKDRIPEVAVFLYGSEEELLEAPAEPETPMSDQQRNELLTRIYNESEPTFRRLLMLAAEREDPTLPVSFKDVTADMGWPTARSLRSIPRSSTSGTNTRSTCGSAGVRSGRGLYVTGNRTATCEYHP